MSKPIEIAIVIENGCVQNVFCSCDDFSYTIVDYDELNESCDDPEEEAERILRDSGFDLDGQPLTN